MIFKFIKFYTSGLIILYSLIGQGKEDLIHEDIIFAPQNFGLKMQYTR